MSSTFLVKDRSMSTTINELAVRFVNEIEGLSEAQKSELIKDTQFISKIIPIVGFILRSYIHGLKNQIPEKKVIQKLHTIALAGAFTVFEDASSVEERALIAAKALVISKVIINTLPATKEISQKITSKL